MSVQKHCCALGVAMSSLDQQHQLLYSHSNNSSLSTIHYQKVPTQVSSVGFNTLKKQVTNSSLTLSIATSNGVKLNTISKLLSRNKSSLAVQEDLILLQSFDENPRPSNDEDQSVVSQRGSGLFRISRKLRAKLKFNNKGVSRPDLTIQTAGHHALKVPKKILSSSTSDEFSNRKAVSSPISRGLFHRQHNQFESSQTVNEETKTRHPKHHRTAMNLSSQSSNSFISDIKVAVLYNFTDPDYSVDDNAQNTDNSRKMQFASADQHTAPSRSHKTDNSVLEKIDAKDHIMRTSIDGNEFDFEKSFAMLFDLLKPLFQPSKQIVLANGVLLPSVELTMEQAKKFVEERIISSARSLLSPRNHKELSGSMPDDRRVKDTKDNLSVNGNLEEDIQDLRRKEWGLQLSSYFEKCCTSLVDDTRNFEDVSALADIVSKTRNRNNDLKYEDQISREEAGQYNYLREWMRVELIWRYFNLKVRFFILNAFQQLQKHFNDEERVHINSGQNSSNVRIENALLIAFRDSVIIPHLMRRPAEPEHESFSHHERVAEIQFFRNEGAALVRALKHCFGTILSHLQSDLVGSDDQPFKEMLFDDYVHWFSEVTR